MGHASCTGRIHVIASASHSAGYADVSASYRSSIIIHAQTPTKLGHAMFLELCKVFDNKLPVQMNALDYAVWPNEYLPPIKKASISIQSNKIRSAVLCDVSMRYMIWARDGLARAQTLDLTDHL